MDAFTLPPSPNWQQSNILACNDDGLLAYGFRGEISLIDLKSDGEFSVSFLNLAHKDKINCLVFSPGEGKFSHCLATCGDDGMVRVWDYKKLRLLYCHSGHKDGVRVVGLDWSHAESNRLVSVNDLGVIVCWDLASNTIRRLHCGVRVLPLCLACCPHDKDLIAIGCKGGATLVVDIKGSGKLIHRLRGNEQDVISVSWCPVPFNVIKHKKDVDPKGIEDCQDSGEKDRDLLLATGGLEKSIFIWRTGSDGRFEIVFNLPTTGMSKNNQRKKGFQGINTPMLWTCVHWVDAYTLLSSGSAAELLLWDLNKVSREGKKHQPRVLHSRHNKGCFSIACPVIYNRVSEWKEERVLWTTAMDKHIIATSLATNSVLKDITTLGGIVCCMAISPLDPNRLAIGSSDSKVFVWNTSDINSLNLATYWKKIIGKVMAVCWHPSEEDLLAYGTSDGHVGLLELGSNKPPILLRLHLRKSVYRVCWAPPLLKPDNAASDSSKLVLFAVGDGDVFQFNANPHKPEEEPQSMNSAVLDSFDKSLGLQKTLCRCDIAFKSDQSCFAVASENGSVYIVSRDSLALQHSLYPHKKLINSIVWHPATVACDNSVSPLRHWLATTCDNIKVYNIPPDGQPELVASLNGHSEKIVSLNWSPHFHGRLLSASYDSTVQVWDVPNQACLAVCPNHCMLVMCALFSSQDPDIVISGSNDCTVRFFAISKMTSSLKPERKKSQVENALKMRSEAEEATELTVGMFSIFQKDEEKIPKRKPSPNTSVQSTGSIQSLVGIEKGLNEKKKHRGQTMFPITSRQLVQAQHFEVMMQRWMGDTDPTPSCTDDTSAPSTADLGYLDFFGDDKAMKRLLLVEESHHIQNKNFLLAQQSALWRGDVTEMIQEAITKKQLNDWLISIAPLAGFELWEKACEVYVDQLTEYGEVSKASMYLLAIHKAHEAVQLLVDHSLFHEAVAIAKCRLAPEDPLIAYAYTSWGKWAQLQGQSILAAHCFLAGGNTQACVEILSRVKELRWLRVAAQLARQVGQVELADSLALECLSLSVTTGNLHVAHQLLAGMPQYQYWTVWLRACELLAKVKNRSEKEVFAWLEGRQAGLFNLCDELNTACVSAGSVYHQLLPHLPTNKTPEFERDMWSYMSGQLAAASAAQLESTNTHFLRHTVSALSAAFHFQTSHPTSLALPLTLMLLAPNGLFAEGSIFQTECKTTEEKQLLKSLRAFACASVVHWMNNNWEKITVLMTPIETGSGDNKSVAEYNMTWLPDLVEACSADVLDAENIDFFVKKAQKEQLQDFVNKENILKKCTVGRVENNNKRKNRKSKLKTVINETDNSLKEDKIKEKVTDDKSTLSGSTKAVEKLNVANENNDKSESTNSLGQSEKEQIVTSKINSSGSEIEKTKPSVELDNTETLPSEISKPTIVNKSRVESHKLIQSPSNDSEKTPQSITIALNENNGSSKNSNTDTTTSKTTENNQSSKLELAVSSSLEFNITNGNDTIRNESDTEKTSNEEPSSKMNQIKDLDEVLLKFEHARESVPNPFTAYINIKYLLDNLVAKQDVKLAEQIQENCDKLWKRSHQ